MKKIFLLCMPVFSFYTLFCQLNASFENDTVSIKIDKNLVSSTIPILITVSGINSAASGISNNIGFAVNPAPATTMDNSLYEVKTTTLTAGLGVKQLEFNISLLRNDIAPSSPQFISLQMSYHNTFIQTKELILKVTNKKDALVNEETEKKHIMYLNAYNFDFGASHLPSNYVGHLNFFAPSSSKDKKWGFNTGIMKINYSQKDTSSNLTVRENVFINPFDTLSAGMKYLKQINGIKFEKSNTVWSFYVQPTYELTDSKDNFHVYAHAHLELLVSKWSSTTTLTNIKQDTGVFSQVSNSFVIRSKISDINTYKVTSLSGYFGAGFTFDIDPWKDGSFFFQPTIGFTSNKPSPASTEISSASGSFSTSRSDDARLWNSFYLVRAYYTHTIAKEKATAVVGVDIRGLLPLYAPQYAIYVGLNLSLDSVLGLLSNK